MSSKDALKELLKSVKNNDAVKAEESFKKVMAEKIVAKIKEHYKTVAKNMFKK
jgi:hypothetical protein